MVKATPISDYQIPAILMQLDLIEKGDSVVYFTGPNLEKCPPAIRRKVTELRQQGRVTFVMRRVTFLKRKGVKQRERVATKNFNYIAQGLKGPPEE